jgi:hypothetical protein
MQVGDIGVLIEIQVVDESGTARDITGATGLSVYLLSPSQVRKQFAGSLTDAAAGRFGYLTVAASDIDEVGSWLVQGGYTLGGQVVRTAVSSFHVGRNL